MTGARCAPAVSLGRGPGQVRDVTIDLEELAAVLRLVKDAEFSEFTYARGETTLQIRRGDLAGLAPMTATMTAPVAPVAAPPPAAAPVSAPAAAPVAPPPPVQEVPGAKVTAPLLGTFYSAPKPGEAAFVKLGDRVTPDTVVCIVEVMKLMNSVTAGVHGVVAAVHVRDGDLVEHGQALFTVAEA